jgi:catechol 2,3-dioxygenase-like lactoylglutathione lyase family enzyme
LKKAAPGSPGATVVISDTFRLKTEIAKTKGNQFLHNLTRACDFIGKSQNANKVTNSAPSIEKWSNLLFARWKVFTTTIYLLLTRFTRNRAATLLVECLSANLLLACSLSAQTAQRPPITGISHFAIFAHDYEKSRAFYGQFLGFEEPYSLKNPDRSASMTFFKINDHQTIELFPERQAGSDRLNHISLETDDIEALRLYLASKGVKVPSEAHRARIGNLSFDITDPEGHTVEMVQYMPQGKTMLAKGQYMNAQAISNRMTHVGIVVTHLDSEYKFYTDILGFKETWRGSKSGQVLSWVNLKVPDGEDYIEFMLYKDAPGLAERGGAHHLCLQVPNVDAAVARLKAEPYYSSYGRPIDMHLGINRKRQANLFDPDGTRTELMEPRTIDGKPATPSTAPPPQ